MKSGCIDFLDFVDKLSSRVAKGDQQILRSNHVTWLLAQIIRIEIVTNALNSDPKQVETTRKILSFHKEDRNSDSNNVNPQSILLDFISSSQTLRIWSFNTSIRGYVNQEQLQKGRQIDEWWKQVTKGKAGISHRLSKQAGAYSTSSGDHATNCACVSFGVFVPGTRVETKPPTTPRLTS
ncbi:mediator of RNA polymerase II transcription subunit 23 isoform X2 [Cinnamomum micranthum f. kanehirae]|uniref:Mediator of RNA polymerase II transcription subunit 23 isoform X2 n=1 Tax=Cinnamomum micranthum f. kanehirae TaxID=337451 RepID=A0A3S3R3U4_9MAGN|nr:mediator of RNA polymerase II transcription subunit 23 isoform X2 [Cinnamomum micranthum f. kanehirae]